VAGIRAISQRISNDIRSLQQGALDQESFQVLYGLLQRKWTEEVLLTTEDLKVNSSSILSRLVACQRPQSGIKPATPTMQPPTIVLKVHIIQYNII
jgi:hypothetical protein